MSVPETLVVKLGGDAVASPGRIASEARRLAALASRGPVVAVTSARRGVTDHLLGLVRGVRDELGSAVAAGGAAEADRAVATGEVVTASLLALALNDLGVGAVSLDAREAGVRAVGRHGGARIQTVSSRRLERLLAQGIVPVVTGFQGWYRGRVATLGRGGTDTSAVALAAALGAARAIFVKDTEGLRSADPKLVPDSLALRDVPHGFLSALTLAGARVIHPDAARLAESHRLTLEFRSLDSDSPATVVRSTAPSTGLWAVATLPLNPNQAQVTAVAGRPEDASQVTDRLRDALLAAAIEIQDIQPAANGPRFIVPAAIGVLATQVVHRALIHPDAGTAAFTRLAS